MTDHQQPPEKSQTPTEKPGVAPHTAQIPAEKPPTGPPTVDDLTVVHPWPGPSGTTADETAPSPGDEATPAPPAGDLPLGAGSAEPAMPSATRTAPTTAAAATAYARNGAVPRPPEPRRYGPSAPTVLAGMLLVALAAAIGVVRLHGASSGTPTATVVVLVVGAVCVVSGALMMLVGRQRG